MATATKGHKRKPKGTRFGRQPAWAAVMSWAEQKACGSPSGITEASDLIAERLHSQLGISFQNRTMRSWLTGVHTPPAEVKLGLAKVLDVELADLWTPDVLAATYGGPRSSSGR